MDYQLRIGKKTKWALIGILMFVIGYLCKSLTFQWDTFTVSGLLAIVLICLSVLLEICLFIAALNADFSGR